MSLQAIAWVLEAAPDVPPHLVAVLVGLANHANEDGRNAYPSQELLAWYARKGDRSVRKDLDALEELGLIRRGNQRVVEYLPADKRPVVWDLALEQRRDPRPAHGLPGRPTANPQLTAREENGGNHTTPGLLADQEIGGAYSSGRAQGVNRGGLQFQIGGAYRPAEPYLEPYLNQEPPTPRASAGEPESSDQTRTPVRACGRDHPDTVACRPCGTNPRARAAAAERTRLSTRRPCREHPGQFADTCDGCRADEKVGAPVPTQREPRRPWCGQCRRNSRMIGHGRNYRSCPTCGDVKAPASLGAP